VASDFRLNYEINEARHRIYLRVRGLQKGSDLLQAMAQLAAEVDGLLSYDHTGGLSLLMGDRL
jgi:hypothetical protein